MTQISSKTKSVEVCAHALLIWRIDFRLGMLRKLQSNILNSIGKLSMMDGIETSGSPQFYIDTRETVLRMLKMRFNQQRHDSRR